MQDVQDELGNQGRWIIRLLTQMVFDPAASPLSQLSDLTDMTLVSGTLIQTTSRIYTSGFLCVRIRFWKYNIVTFI